MIDISIIVLNYNTQILTEQCIDSILKFTTDITYEIILVDNASNPIFDNIKYINERIVKIIRSEINTGFSKGNNIGISQAAGEFILLLNSDVVLIENSIKICLDKIKSDVNIGVITPKILIDNKELQYTACRFPSIYLELREFLRINKFTNQSKLTDLYLGTAFDHNSEKEADWIHGTFFLFNRNIIDKLGGKLPDQFFMYGEDMQWCWQIKKLGYKIIYYPETSIIHYAGSSLPKQASDDKFFSKLFPNTYQVVCKEKGRIYAWLLYFIKAIHLLTLHNKPDYAKAKQYLSFLFTSKR